MLSLSPAVAVEAAPPVAPTAGPVKDAGTADTFSDVVGRLIDGQASGDAATAPARPAPVASGQPGAVAAPTATDAESDGNALLLALAASSWYFTPPARPEDVAGEPPVAEAAVADVPLEAAVAAGSDSPIALAAAAVQALPLAAAPATAEPTPELVDAAGATAAGAPVVIDTAPAMPAVRELTTAPTLLAGAPGGEANPAAPIGRGEKTNPALGTESAQPLESPAVSVTDRATPAAVEGTFAPSGVAEPQQGTAEQPVAAPDVRPPDTRPMRLSPQGLRLAAALSQANPHAVGQITTAAVAVETGRLVVEATRGEASSTAHAAAATRAIDVALPEQAAQNAVRESSTRFLSFDTSVAALAAESFQVQATDEAGLGTSTDVSSWTRDRGAYDLRAAVAQALPDLADAHQAFALDTRAALAATAPTAASEAVVPAGSLPDGTHAATGDVPTQIVRAMHMQWRDGVGEARLTLTPESLGEVTITMKVDRGVVTATVKADNPVTMEWIRSHQHELRDALDAQGLRLDQFEVSVDPDDRRQRDEAPKEQAPRRPRQAPSADAPRFELVV